MMARNIIGRENEPVAVERMWVLVRERIDGGCLGVLNNDPYAVAQNDGLWSGVELPFSARHVIDIRECSEKTIALTAQTPKTRWPQM